MRWIIHRDPFHRSANVTVFSPLGPIDADPTAIQALLEVHETDDSELPLVPDGLGTRWIDQ